MSAPVQAQEPESMKLLRSLWSDEGLRQLMRPDQQRRIEECLAPVQPVADADGAFKLAAQGFIFGNAEAVESAKHWFECGASHSAVPVKEHVVRQVVNDLRDTAIKFRDTQQLRERLRSAIEPLLNGRDSAGATLARQLIDSGAENYIGEVFDTERGDIEVTARYTHGKTPADKLAELESAIGESKLSVGVQADAHGGGVMVAVHLNQGGHTTVLYTQRHPANRDTFGVLDVSAPLFTAAIDAARKAGT